MAKKRKDSFQVAEGHTVMTKRGLAYPGAPISDEQLSGGTEERYKLVKSGFLVSPADPKKILGDGSQIAFEHEERLEEKEEPEELEEKDSPDQQEKKSAKKVGAKRK